MRSSTVYRVLAVAILIGFGAHHYALTRKPPGVEAYHARIRASAERVPLHIGEWVGDDVPVPARANTVLRPNVIISKRYTDVENGRMAGLLLVHCADAHSMAGHFPLRCYPAAGWTLQKATARDWVVDDLRLTGTEYAFTMNELGHTRSIVVANVLFLPGGKVLRDMNSMAAAIVGVGGQASGAGQLQIYFDASVPQEQRDQAIRDLVGGYKGLILTILGNVSH